MAPYKAAGKDGIHAVFYQNLWEIVGDMVSKFALDFFQSGVLPKGANDTLSTLIPKVPHVDALHQFRPISLCNISYKVSHKNSYEPT